MEPIELLGPNGEPWSYCCGICGRIAGVTHSSVIDRSQLEGSGRHPNQVASEKAHAELCCLCRRCREKAASANGFMYCAECKPIADKELEEAREDSRKRMDRLSEAREASLAKAKSKNDALDLIDAIRDFSEEAHWSAWHPGVEFEAWQLALESNVDCAFMLDLSEECGGWWYWSEEYCGELFVTTEEWEKMVAEREKK